MHRTHNYLLAVVLLAVMLLLASCTPAPTPKPTPILISTQTLASPPQATPTQEPIPAGILISEVQAGIQGNNNADFIELYNPGDFPLDLKGWSISFQLDDQGEETTLVTWQTTNLVPPRGHYLLTLEGQDLGVVPDAIFTQPLVPTKGGLSLLDPDRQAADSLAWGRGPTSLAETSPAPPLQNNQSLERLPGGELGNHSDAGDNAADFTVNQKPNPQNSGSAPTPATGQLLDLTLNAPLSIDPGSEFTIELQIHNPTIKDARGLQVQFPLPVGLTLQALPESAREDSGVIVWDISDLAAGTSVRFQIQFKAPWTYLDIPLRGTNVSGGDGFMQRFNSPVYAHVEGGAIPIRIARGLIGTHLTVEGTVTMYTGGFYAGSGSKFYIEDNTGGAQVYVPGGGSLKVPIGAFVRTTGLVDLYRGSVELIPDSPEDVEILKKPAAGSDWPALPVSISDAANDKINLPGKLAVVEGTAIRVEEFSYSYEIDLADEDGNIVTAYIDKLTNSSVEAFETGMQMRLTGIMEFKDDTQTINPRQQSDLVEVFPPTLLVEASMQSTALPGETFPVTLTVYNHTPEEIHNIVISVQLPASGAVLNEVQDGGVLNGRTITWTLPALQGLGASQAVHYRLTPTIKDGFIAVSGYLVSAEGWETPVSGDETRTFIGTSVPIWSIQGTGSRSPHVLQTLTTRGIVTAYFPDLGGFWIQELDTDDDPRTSEGLFISGGDKVFDFYKSISPLDLIEVTGVVRERYQETQIIVDSLDSIRLIKALNSYPSPVELDPPADMLESQAYFESLEGMVVQVTQPARVVAATNRYGEYVVVLVEHNRDRLLHGEQNGIGIMVDDGESSTNYDSSEMEYVVKTGDIVTDIFGPLAYTFGAYKVEPLYTPTVQSEPKELPRLVPTGSDEFSLMTWNVENIFDILDPHPSSPPMPTKAEYNIRLAKIANTILYAGAPTIIGLEEVENLKILEELANLDALKEYHYQAILIEGTDSRGIDVGYLVRGDRTKILHVEQFNAPEGLTSRPPLLIQVEIQTDSGPVVVFVTNNHFTSMSGSEASTEPRRSAQAAWNLTVFQQVLSDNPDAFAAIMGDLNSYYDSKPIDTLREGGFRHVFESLDPTQRYTYIYKGQSQVLDHILVSESLMKLLRRVEVLHVNPDFPPHAPGDTSPMSESDHDPVVAVFSLNP